MQELKGAKMNWKNRLTNYNFWISIFSAVLLILQALKIEFDIAYVNEIFTAVLGLLVVIGIVSDPTRTTVKANDSTKQNNKVEKNNETTDAEQQLLSTEKDKKELLTSALPIEEKNETYNVDSENDIQTILTTISAGIDEKIKELTEINLNALNKFAERQYVMEKQKEMENNKKQTSQEDQPAVAEISNPYVDVIN